ncbi:hypothetical protein Tco_1119705 [Tanacetum coccineum]
MLTDRAKRFDANLSVVSEHEYERITKRIIVVETVDGLEDLHVPPGTQSGETIKLSKIRVTNINKLYVRGHHHFTVNICKDKDEAEVWFSGLKALISRGHQRKWRTESRSDGIPSEANSHRTYTRRNSPLHSPFGSGDNSQKAHLLFLD